MHNTDFEDHMLCELFDRAIIGLSEETKAEIRRLEAIYSGLGDIKPLSPLDFLFTGFYLGWQETLNLIYAMETARAEAQEGGKT